MVHRLPRALALAGALTLLAAAPALAGNWAEVVPEAGTTDEVAAGTPHEFAVTLLQHGETPVAYGAVEIRLTDAEGAVVSAPATHLGAGRWAATLTLPTGGTWTLTATHDTLATDLAAGTALTVAAPVAAPSGGAAASAPMLPALAVAAILALLAAAAGAWALRGAGRRTMTLPR